MKSASGPAAMAGALLLLLWSIQIGIFNLLILFLKLRSNRKFIVQATCITVFSVVFIPSGVFLMHHAGLMVMGEPKLANYLHNDNTRDCDLAETLKVNRINDWVRTIQANVQCGPDKTKKTCEWYFEYQHERGVWVNHYTPSCQ